MFSSEKALEREPGQTDARSRFGNQLNAFCPLLMTEEAFQRAVTGPAAIAIHNDGDVLRQTLGLSVA